MAEFLQERQLYADEDVPRLRALDAAAAPIVSFLHSPQLVQELRPNNQYNIHRLQECFQVPDLQPSPDSI
ncbi:hypothetical protein GUJ93_ZPchr0002g25768 [Zizania palustris]|uniref:Eukaryotic translation initiation factor 3 subunit E N-terminal domain-containing protein n=1 Tax=Zizania palustris TaxID=103762 RepID=A0A8J5RV02_ZIZPA|nr:hypothetical protein GUJ93_ZPchr0002g25768 [Zizania palustris]